MSQTLDHLPHGESNKILCTYVNATSQIQVARITNIPNWYFERVVFPGQRLVFEAHCSAVLEIHSGMMASAILSDTIPCTKLNIGKSCQDQDQPRSTEMKLVEKQAGASLAESEAASPLNIAV
ncbi:MAG: DUF1830 domain-containing protein [Cyanobacteria bacterium J06600_6]